MVLCVTHSVCCSTLPLFVEMYQISFLLKKILVLSVAPPLSAGQRDSHPLSLQFPLLTTRCDNNSMMEVNGAVNVENISNIQYICQIAAFFQNQILNAAVNEVLFELNWYTVYAGGLHNRNCGWSATDRQRLCRGKIRCVHNSY